MAKNTLGNSPLQNDDRITIERKGVPSETTLQKVRQYANGTEIISVIALSNLEIDFSVGILQNIILSQSSIFTFVNATPGVYILKIVQGAGGSRTITWPSNVRWSGGTPPTLTTTAGAWDMVTLIWDGTYFSGTSTLNFTA